MLRAVPFVVGVVLAIYCLVEIARSDPAQVRLLPRWLWALLALVPFAGAAGWLLFGRPNGTRREPPRGPQQAPPIAPDDDPDFLRRLGRGRPGRDPFGSWEQELRDDDGEEHRPR